MRIETLAVHAGRPVDPTTGSVTPPIHLSTTFQRDEDGSYPKGYVYSRAGNPNRTQLEESLAALGRNRSGGRPGASSSFTSALADIVTEAENASPVTSAEREAGWLALELLESE